MEAMIQTWKNIVLTKDLHLRPTVIYSSGDGWGNNKVDTNDGSSFFCKDQSASTIAPPLDKECATHPTQQVAITHPTHEHKKIAINHVHDGVDEENEPTKILPSDY
jgi:hypothetical protein